MSIGIFLLIILTGMTNLTNNQIEHLVKMDFKIPLSQINLMAWSIRPPNLVKWASALINKATYYIKSIRLTK
jgi:hypothetical protein